jgi:hypothetical protein
MNASHTCHSIEQHIGTRHNVIVPRVLDHGTGHAVDSSGHRIGAAPRATRRFTNPAIR